MQLRSCAIVALLGSVLGLSAEPAAAQPYGHRHRAHRHHARMLPPEIPYRDPSVDLSPHGRPDFLIRAYLPRFTETPVYNEPPARFPQR